MYKLKYNLIEEYLELYLNYLKDIGIKSIKVNFFYDLDSSGDFFKKNQTFEINVNDFSIDKLESNIFPEEVGLEIFVLENNERISFRPDFQLIYISEKNKSIFLTYFSKYIK